MGKGKRITCISILGFMVAFMVAWVKNWIFVLVSACFLWEKWTLNLCKLGDLIGNHLEQLAGMLLGEAFAVRQNINSNNWCTFPSKRLFLIEPFGHADGAKEGVSRRLDEDGQLQLTAFFKNCPFYIAFDRL